VGALIVRESGLLDGVLALFESTWEQAAPIVPGDPELSHSAADRLSEVDTRVVSLLGAGLTDHAIGAQLGLSMRSVQRRVRRLMDLIGVDTRFQLGVEEALRGWTTRATRVSRTV
jgi:DNA-binding NarL/FixJ family response regulator